MRSLLVVAGLLASITLRPAAGEAVTFVVDSTADAHDAGVANVLCETASGTCTLRAAIEQAAAHPGPDAIELPAGTYGLTLGKLTLGSDLTVTGDPAPSASVVDGGMSDTVFEVSGSPTVTLQDLTIQHGQAPGSCLDLGGGGLCNPGGVLTLVRCILTNNTAFLGSAIANAGTLTVIDSTIAANVGTAIVNAGGTLTLTHSTVSGNGDGLVAFAGAVDVIDATVSGNANRALAGLCPLGIGACPVVTLRNATIVGTVASESAAATHAIRMRNTILAGACTGTLISEGYDVLDAAAAVCSVTGDSTGNQIGVDPQLAPLGANGGPTETHALEPTSPALGSAHPAPPGSGGLACEATDQRGFARPAGPRCDVGAVEGGCIASGVCGDGIAEGCEQCDDGNTAPGDCCDPSCRWEATGTTCDDGNACTNGDQCNTGTCSSGTACDADCEVCTPGVGCGPPSALACAPAAPRSTLAITDSAGPAKSKSTWKWKSVAAVALGDFGNPATTTAYRLCLYDGDGRARLVAMTPVGGICASNHPCWKALKAGWRFRDSAGTADGVTGITLSVGGAGSGRIAVEQKGSHMQLSSLVLTPPLRMRLTRVDDGHCWESTYDGGITRNTAESFRAKSE